MMSERIKFKDGEKSQLALFCNAKEEILLNKKLRTLESLKKQAENAVTLDQRILYKRFTIKLRRSELAHAKLLGHKDLVKLLSQSLFPNLHSVVTDGSETAVRFLLQNTEASRALSAPPRIQGHLAGVSVAKKLICEGLQGKEAEVKDVQKCLGHMEEAKTHVGEKSRDTSGAENTLCEKETDFSKPANFLEHRRPYTTNYEKHNRQSNLNDRCQKRLVKNPSGQQNSDATLPVKSFTPEGFVDRGLNKDFLDQKGLSGKNKKSHKPRPNSRNLFLGLNSTLLGRYPSTNNYTILKNDSLLNDKVKLFLQKITDLQQEQSCLLQDYYSERLQEKLGKKYQENQDCLPDTEQEQSK